MAMPIMGQEKPDEEALPTFVKDVETTIAADVVSQYIWRGQDLGNVIVRTERYKGVRPYCGIYHW